MQTLVRKLLHLLKIYENFKGFYTTELWLFMVYEKLM